MPRIARLIAAGYPHHITQRGNYQQKIFFSQKDRILYLNLMREYTKKYDVTLQ